MQKNKKGFSLVLAMGLVLISSLAAYTILEYIMPFSKNIKGIEDSASAYYQANSGVQRAMYYFGQQDDDQIHVADTSKTTFSSNTDYKYTTTTTSSSTLPIANNGDSETDNDYNTIKVGKPIQMSVGYGYMTSINNVMIEFKVPDIGTITSYTLSGATDLGIVNWQLSAPGNTLNSDGSLFTVSDINSGSSSALYTLAGEDLSGTNPTLGTFYTNNCLSTKCILKFSIVEDLTTVDTGTINSITLPYLEWKLTTGAGNSVPLRYSIIDSMGRAGNYSRELEVRYPQETVSEAFDFTVFQ